VILLLHKLWTILAWAWRMFVSIVTGDKKSCKFTTKSELASLLIAGQFLQNVTIYNRQFEKKPKQLCPPLSRNWACRIITPMLVVNINTIHAILINSHHVRFLLLMRTVPKVYVSLDSKSRIKSVVVKKLSKKKWRWSSKYGSPSVQTT